MRWRDIGSDHFTWNDFRAIARQLPRTSALYRSRYPDKVGWDANTLVLANIADLLAWANYYFLRSRGARPKRPKPHPRPGVLPDGVQQLKSKPVPLAKLRERLGRKKAT